MHRLVAGRFLALLIVGGLILWSSQGQPMWADTSRSLADRILTLELRVDELQNRLAWLIGLIGADLLGTLALLRKAKG